MQQSSATPSLHLWFLGVAEDCCMLSILLAVPSCFNSFWHGVIPTSYFTFNDFYTCIYIVRAHVRDRPDCRAGGGDVLLRMRHTHKMATNTSGNSGRALSFAILTVSPSLFVAKDQSRLVIESFGVKIIVFSQTNSSVGVMKKKKKRKRWRKSRLGRFPCITVAVYFSYFGSVVRYRITRKP